MVEPPAWENGLDAFSWLNIATDQVTLILGLMPGSYIVYPRQSHSAECSAACRMAVSSVCVGAMCTWELLTYKQSARQAHGTWSVNMLRAT